MNKLSIAAVILLFFTFLSYPQDKQPVIEVTGTAEIKIAPDMMEMFINIDVDDDDLITAKNKNDESTRKVLGVLKGLNINDKDIITGGIEMQKVRDSYKKTVTYSVSNDIIMKTSNIELYENLTTELIRIENVYITSTNLSSTKAIETRTKAREDALLAAKKKAEEMAAVLNMSVGKPVMITENSGSYYPGTMNVSYNMIQPIMDYSGEIFKAGLISISSSVRVVFSLTDK